jgi:cytochrome P450
MASFHPFDQNDTLDPYSSLAEARLACPVMRCHRDGLPDAVLVSRYDDVCTAFRDYKTFGNMSSKISIQAHDAALSTMPGIGDLDPPRHTEVRRLLNIAMAPRAIAVAEAHIAELARQLVNTGAETGRIDLIRDWAIPIPSSSLAHVLGLPEADWPMINNWVAAQFSDANIDTRRNQRGVGVPSPEFVEYVRKAITERRAHTDRHDDALAKMTAFERADGTIFSIEELVHHVRTLITAGNETTTSLMCNVVRRLLADRAAMASVRADVSLIPMAIEESLRLDSPVGTFNRRVRRPSLLGDVDLGIDDVLAVSISSANRDESVWGDDADRFRLDRFADGNDAPGHLGFGLGVHLCVGAPLARMSAQIGLRALIEGTSDLQLDPDWRYENIPHHALNRPRSLTVRCTPRR